MRILNRPMFRSGGPIKEGVMHGMRGGGRTIAGGHQIGTPMGNRTGFADPLNNPGYWTNLWGATKNLFNPLRRIKKVQKVAPQIKKGVDDLRGIFVRKPPSSGITSSPAAQSILQNLRSFPGASKIGGWATKAKDIALKYPKSTAAAALYGGVPLATNLPYKKIASTIADVAVPDQIYNWETGRWFNSDDTDLKPSDKKILKEKKIEAIGEGAQFKDTTPELTASQRTKLAKDQQNARLKSYLDMMGYDSAKKTAMSDALIDASALVQDATTEAGSLKKADWGSLINRMIQTTSKRLDKPEQIREAVGLMATKAEIEKDIAKGKENVLDQQVSTLMNNLGYDKATATRVAKGLPKDLREQVIVDMGTSKQALTHSSLTSSVKKWYPEAIALLDTTEVKKQLGNQSAEEFITEKIKTNPTTNKIYIVGKEVVKVDGKGNTSTIFP